MSSVSDLIQQAEQALSENNIEKAVECYQKCIDLEPTNKGLYVSLSLLYSANNDWDNAKVTGEKLLELDSEYYMGHFITASAEMAQGNLDEAIEIYNKGLNYCDGHECDELRVGKAGAEVLKVILDSIKSLDQ